jgi:hypothetical protein
VAAEFTMTGEQFAKHLIAMLWGLDRLRNRFPELIEQLRAEPCEFSVVGSPLTLLARERCIQQRDARIAALSDSLPIIDEAVAATGRVVGDDWYAIGVDHKNWQAVAYRLDQRAPDVVLHWYTLVAQVLDLGHYQIAAELDFQLVMASSDASFWRTMSDIRSLPGEAFGVLVKLAGDAARVAARAAGDLTRSVVGGVFEGAGPVIGIAALVLGGFWLFGRSR